MLDVGSGGFEGVFVGLSGGVCSEAAAIDHAVVTECRLKAVDDGGDVAVWVLAGGWDGREFDEGVGVFGHRKDDFVLFGEALEWTPKVIDDDVRVGEGFDQREEVCRVFGFEMELNGKPQVGGDGPDSSQFGAVEWR